MSTVQAVEPENWGTQTRVREVAELEVELEPPPIVTPGILAGLVAGIGLLIVVVWNPYGNMDPVVRGTIALFVAAASFGPLYFSYRLHHEVGRRTLALFSDRLQLPLSVRANHELGIPLSGITGIVLHEGGRKGMLIIGTSAYDFMYPTSAFTSLADLRAFVEGVKNRLRRVLPHGERAVDAFEAESSRTAEALLRRPVAVWGLLGAMALALVGLTAAGCFREVFGSVRFGALSRALVLDGDWYRVWSHPFVFPTGRILETPSVVAITPLLHGFALLYLGRPLERLIGPDGILALFFAGATAGALFVVGLNDAALIQGAGGSIFAFIGATAFLAATAKGRIPLGFRMALRDWFWAAILGMLVLLPPDMTLDMALGGILAGAIVAAVYASGPLPRGNAPPGMRAVAIAGVVLHLTGVAVAYARAPGVGLLAVREVVQANRDFDRLNFYAWRVALDPDATAPELEVAETAARNALALASDTQWEASIADTLATVQYRRGEFAEAVRLERSVLQDSGDAITASQLARFLWAARGSAGVKTSTVVQVSLQAQVSSDRRLEVAPATRGTLSQPMTVWAVAHDDGQLKALLRLGLEPGPDVDQTQAVDTPEPLEWTASTTIAVLEVLEGKSSSKAWAFDEKVGTYP